MTIDPAVLVAFIGTILGLLGVVIRQFMAGNLLSRTVVPREDYDRVVAINEGYAARFGEQTEAVKTLAVAVDRLASNRTT